MAATFAAKRTYTSGELLALKRQQVERTQTRPPSIHLQDSSEQTARVRKYASVMSKELPFSQVTGNSTNMVKWRDASVVQAMKEGQVYRTAASSYEPRTDKCTVQCAPNQFLQDTQGDTRFPTAPKAVGCARPERGEVRVLEAFNLAEHFGMRKNDNKVVMSQMPPFTPGTCKSCDWIEK